MIEKIELMAITDEHKGRYILIMNKDTRERYVAEVLGVDTGGEWIIGDNRKFLVVKGKTGKEKDVVGKIEMTPYTPTRSGFGSGSMIMIYDDLGLAVLDMDNK